MGTAIYKQTIFLFGLGVVYTEEDPESQNCFRCAQNNGSYRLELPCCLLEMGYIELM